jgi:DNA-binding Lrp family transcriptional regulator
MLELNPFRKNKVNLEDYDYQRDIQNRLMMATFAEQDLQVLEEILYGHPKISIAQLAQDLIIEEAQLVQILKKLADTGLFYIKDHSINLNKEMRKYFEAQLLKFEESFVPGMEYLQTLLRKVPFHILLSWYPIPRTSNNIFDSLVEKYLLTPQIFQRYLMELNFGNPKISSIVEDVYNAPDFMLLGSELKKKYDLSNKEFEEILLHLEFNFVCCLAYKKIQGRWEQIVSPFYEWREYLRFVRDHKPLPIEDSDLVRKYRDSDFSFIEDMTTLLKLAKSSPLSLTLNEQERWIPDKVSMKLLTKHIPAFNPGIPQGTFEQYAATLIHKLLFLKLCKVDGSSLKSSDGSDEWLALSIENRALAVYKHTIFRLEQADFSSEIATERTVREIEKTITPVVHLDWMCFDEFMKSVAAPMSKENKIVLKKIGKGWKYVLPSYSEEEARLIKTIILNWLFEAGLVSVGYLGNKQCFRVTAFGQTIFS